MSKIHKGHYSLSIIDSTGQFSVEGDGYTDGRVAADTDLVNSAKDLISLLKAYVALMED